MEFVPGRSYFLKWKTLKPDGSINNLLVLQGTFITYFNNEHCEQYRETMYLHEKPPELIGTIYNTQNELIEYPFDNPLYPYQMIVSPKMSCRFGLFKINKLLKSVFNGVRRSIPVLQFPEIVGFSRVNTDRSIINNRTLMWVNLYSMQSIPNSAQMALERHTVDNLPGLVRDVKEHEIKEYLGGKKRTRNRQRRNRNTRRRN